jgi:hypothetical protein
MLVAFGGGPLFVWLERVSTLWATLGGQDVRLVIGFSFGTLTPDHLWLRWVPRNEKTEEMLIRDTPG